MMSSSERRNRKRVPIQVLVNCLPSKKQRGGGHSANGWEMWARNLGDDGVGLRWSLKWSLGRCPHCLQPGKRGSSRKEVCQAQSPAKQLKVGEEIQMDGLVYDDNGSPVMTGKIQWISPSKDGKTVELGIFVTSPDHQSYFKALEA